MERFSLLSLLKSHEWLVRVVPEERNESDCVCFNVSQLSKMSSAPKRSRSVGFMLPFHPLLPLIQRPSLSARYPHRDDSITSANECLRVHVCVCVYARCLRCLFRSIKVVVTIVTFLIKEDIASKIFFFLLFVWVCGCVCWWVGVYVGVCVCGCVWVCARLPMRPCQIGVLRLHQVSCLD